MRQLLAAIRSTTGNKDADWASPPRQLTGGFWAELWRVRLAHAPGLDRELVARIMPDPVVAARETLVQSHLGDKGFSTPRVRLHLGPTAQLDRAWMLMDFAIGDPLIPNLSGAGTLLRLPRIARSMPDTLALCAADLHKVPSGDLAARLGGDDSTLGYIKQRQEIATALNRPELMEFAESLLENRPSEHKTVICHGDLHPFNLLMGEHGYIALDWSTAQLTDPTHDLAFAHLLLSNPPLEAPGALSPAISGAGKLLGRRFLKSYETYSQTSIDPERFTWFTALHGLRVLIEVAIWEQAEQTQQHGSHPFLKLAPTLRRRYLGSQLAG
jgi:aminoglycoside phosphotransferase (APT) family kinase protein